MRFCSSLQQSPHLFPHQDDSQDVTVTVMRAVLAIKQGEYKSSEVFIDQTRRLLDSKVNSSLQHISVLNYLYSICVLMYCALGVPLGVRADYCPVG